VPSRKQNISIRHPICSYANGGDAAASSVRNPIEIEIAAGRPASAANASGFVQIPLSQVPRRETLGSTRVLGAGALVDGVLRFNNSYKKRTCPESVAVPFNTNIPASAADTHASVIVPGPKCALIPKFEVTDDE
jgi:hypothetical protein